MSTTGRNYAENRHVWSDLKMLAEVLPVKPMSSSCDCGDTHHHGTQAIAFDDGWCVKCLNCGVRWVEWRLGQPSSK